ncbi:hypothetical protein AMJ83_11475 [candidate division WOR_3 bacterium SM23_42]|uniref:MucB/RseB N-terminal domain-containing protein n=1 Tax=candidate division WOR_3 bacterium SM23_42 TaxID=1703779 RepID=A0A0S8FRJ6_UNCW3|nr:MAG: hypothetical protein AMJ83_11475 [candidate division WOR_3 bacterium SM23_42]
MEKIYYCYMVLIVLLTPFACSAALSVDEICQIMQERESVIRSIKYEMTQIKHRTVEGTKLLEQLRPGTVLKLDEPEAPARRDFIRVREGEKDFVKDIHYDDDLKTIVGQVLHTWDGSIGKRYVPESKSGRVERNRFSISEEFVERAGLELMGKPVHQWLTERRETVQIKETADGTLVEFEVQRDIIARYVLDPSKGFTPKSYRILKAAQTAYEMKVNKFEHYNVDGVDVYFPVEYESVMSIPRAVGPIEKGKIPKVQMIPLVVATVNVKKVEFNPEIPERQFDIEFPPDAKVYDEFLGETVPTTTTEKILIHAIDEQVAEYSRQIAESNGSTQSKAPGLEKNSGGNKDVLYENEQQDLSNQGKAKADRAVDSKYHILWGSVAIIGVFFVLLILLIKHLLRGRRQRAIR